MKIISPAIVIAAVLIIIFLLASSFQNTETFGEIKKFFKTDDKIPSQQNPQPNSQSNSDNSQSQSSSATAQTLPEKENSNCQIQQISYSMSEFLQTQNCNLYENQKCVDKTLNCSVLLKNLDSAVSGEFRVKFSLLQDEKIISNFLNSREQKKFEIIFNIQGAEADNELNCIIAKESVPTKQIC